MKTVNKKNTLLAGFDIGGTKCAVLLGCQSESQTIDILGKQRFATADFRNPENCLAEMGHLLEHLFQEQNIHKHEVAGIGISCGGPLDSEHGIIQSPPNLPGWDNIPVVKLVESQTGLHAKLENDANACALAEWKFGAGRGTQNMIFLTFGTGLGAGIIANGRLLSGHSGMAGECGHIRLATSGPLGYGKNGSFEGFCSGGGIAQLGVLHAKAALKAGHPLDWCPTYDALLQITAKKIGDAAENGDAEAISIYRESGEYLGRGLAVLIDLLNPECIVIGSIFARSEHLLRPAMERTISEEALTQSASVCRIVPAQLGEGIGDIASLAIIAKG